MTVRANKPAFNVREKLKELERPIGVKGNELMRAETAQDARDLVSAGRRNLIINGDFRISQRGDYTSSAVTAGHDSYWLDRWMSLKNGTTSTVQRVTRTVNGISQYAARIECTVAGNGIMGFNQRVELSNIPVGRTLTASAWVRTNHPYVGFRTNLFQGSGGDRGVKVTPDGNWHRIYWTFDSTGTTSGDPDILITAYNNASVSIAVGDYIEIAEVQLEVGKNATDFEHRSYGEELALCQRYYEKSFPDDVAPATGTTTTSLLNGGQPASTLDWYATFSAGTLATYHYFRVPKRGTPQMTFLGTSNNKCVFYDFGTKSVIYPGLIIDSPTKIGFRSYNNGSGLTNNSSWGLDIFNWTAEAEL